MAKVSRTILLVDESKTFQELFLTLLADTGYELKVCNTGSEALAIINREYVDFVCSALYLKDMEGIALCQKVRSLTQYAHKPFVLLTS